MSGSLLDFCPTRQRTVPVFHWDRY